MEKKVEHEGSHKDLLYDKEYHAYLKRVSGPCGLEPVFAVSKFYSTACFSIMQNYIKDCRIQSSS